MEAVYDPTIAYVTASGGRYAGHDLPINAPIVVADEPSKPGELTAAQVEQLVNGGKLVPATSVRPTPVETPEAAVERLSDLERIEGDDYLIRAPWLGEGETVKGREAATERLAEVKLEGLELYRTTEAKAAQTTDAAGAAEVAGQTLSGEDDGFKITDDGSNGYYTITKPDGETERVRGKANAEDRLVELRAEAKAREQEEAGKVDAIVTAGEAGEVDKTTGNGEQPPAGDTEA